MRNVAITIALLTSYIYADCQTNEQIAVVVIVFYRNCCSERSLEHILVRNNIRVNLRLILPFAATPSLRLYVYVSVCVCCDFFFTLFFLSIVCAHECLSFDVRIVSQNIHQDQFRQYI